MREPLERQTDSVEYAREMARSAGRRWKRVLNVQAPYRWNLRRLARGRVLEVGCGIGRNLAALPGSVGVDHNADSIAIARAAGLRAWTTEEWAKCPDAQAGSFDTLLIAHVLEHVSEEVGSALLEEYVGFLRPRARLVLICPQEAGFRSDPATHVRFVTGVELAEHARDAGFVPVTNISFPLPRIAGRVFLYNEFVLAADRAE